MNLSISQAKAAIRKSVAGRLAALSPERQARESARLCALIQEAPFWKTARSILFFAPISGEPDLWPALAAALAQAKSAALPFFEAENTAYSARFIHSVENDIQVGRYGIREPRPACPVAPLNQLDLLLVPGVAFDTSGRRLGRGRGFYDRLLALASGTKCGVAYDEQIVDAIPSEPHDIRLDHILTPALT